MKLTRQVLVGLLAVALLLAPMEFTGAEQSPAPSQAVAHLAQTAMVNLNNRLRAGTATATDYATAAAALNAMFANFDETGVTARLQAAFIAHAQEFVSPSSAAIHQVYLLERQAGLTETESEVAERYSTHSAEDMTKAVAYIRDHGVAALDAALVQALTQRATASLAAGNAKLHSVQDIRAICAALSILAIYGDTISLMLAAGVITLPAGVVLAAGSLTVTGLAFLLCT